MTSSPPASPTSCGSDTPFPGATPAARQSRFRGVSGLGLTGSISIERKEPMFSRLTSRIAAMLALAAVGLGAQAQTLEGGPLHIVVGYSAGGATDRVARIVADK